MKLNFRKRRVMSLLRSAEFFEVIVSVEMLDDEVLFEQYFDEDFLVSLHVDGARVRGHTLTASRPITKVKFNLKDANGLDLLFAYESDANIFIERLKEQVSGLLKLLREKHVDSHSFDGDSEEEL